jgi:hypothetical protein
MPHQSIEKLPASLVPTYSNPEYVSRGEVIAKSKGKVSKGDNPLEALASKFRAPDTEHSALLTSPLPMCRTPSTTKPTMERGNL